MQRLFAFALATFAALTLAPDVDAKRLGGGKSFGSQRQSIAPPAAPTAPSATTPGAAANPVMPAQPGMAAAKAAPAAAAPAAAAGGASRWLGPIAGLAAGLGLAALLSHFGLSEGFASILLMVLLGVAAFVVLKMLFGRRTAPAGAPLQYAGARSGSGEPVLSAPPRATSEPAFGTGAAVASRFPPGFDADGFAQQAKLQFNRLQAAYDRNDHETLADVLTPEMFAEVTSDIEARGTHVATTVEALEAEVLQATTEGDRHWVSVRFTGRTREDGGAAQAFDEIWNLAKPIVGSAGWQLAGIQQAATA